MKDSTPEVCEKNGRHSIWLRNLDYVSVGIIDLTFFTFILMTANHHPFPPHTHTHTHMNIPYHQNSACVFVKNENHSRSAISTVVDVILFFFYIFYYGSGMVKPENDIKRVIKSKIMNHFKFFYPCSIEGV